MVRKPLAFQYPGHVTGLVNGSGQVAHQYRYTPWGEAESVTESETQPLRYMARELDPITGLYYVRARWYDPVLARFVSEDPIGLAGGINPYAYVGNSPLNFRDPSGLDHLCYDITEVRTTSEGISIRIVGFPGCKRWAHRGSGGTSGPGDPVPVSPSSCDLAGCRLRDPYDFEFEFVVGVLAGLRRQPAFCQEMAAAGLEMVNRRLAYWDNRVNGDRGPIVGNAPDDPRRGGPVMYLYSKPQHPRIAVAHEAVHGVIEGYDGIGRPYYYPDSYSRNSPRATPLGTP